MKEFEARVLFRPETPELRFLPEGPYPYQDGKFSWVGIQHGGDAKTGSLNIYDLATNENKAYELDGRPGFAYATNQENKFVVGLERQVRLFDIGSGEYIDLSETVDADVENTIINDGMTFDGNLIFGCKDLEFKDKKAGLYLLRGSDRQLVRFRSDQICSNGKILLKEDDSLTLLDIDTPTKTVVAYLLDVAAGTLGEAHVVLDLRDYEAFPDGMIATPDNRSVIISFYNPNDAEAGETRQYGIESGELETIWKTPGAPQVTCPQLVRFEGQIKLITTTAVEHMSDERQAQHPNSGSLFIADTDFDELPETPVFEL